MITARFCKRGLVTDMSRKKVMEDHLMRSALAGNLDDLLKVHVREALRSKVQAGIGDRRSLPYNR